MPQSDQIKHTFDKSIEHTFETLDTAEIYMNTYHSMIEPIINRNFGNTFHHHNGKNKRQHTNKNSSQKYHQIISRQQYQHRSTGKPKHSKQYQPQ